MPYAQLLPRLLEFQLVKLHTLLLSTNSPPDDGNARCEFHSGAPGHDVNKYKALQYRIRDLLDAGAFMFTPDGLNMQVNLFQIVARKVVTTSHSQGSASYPGSLPPRFSSSAVSACQQRQKSMRNK